MKTAERAPTPLLDSIIRDSGMGVPEAIWTPDNSAELQRFLDANPWLNVPPKYLDWRKVRLVLPEQGSPGLTPDTPLGRSTSPNRSPTPIVLGSGQRPEVDGLIDARVRLVPLSPLRDMAGVRTNDSFSSPPQTPTMTAAHVNQQRPKTVAEFKAEANNLISELETSMNNPKSREAFQTYMEDKQSNTFRGRVRRAYNMVAGAVRNLFSPHTARRSQPVLPYTPGPSLNY